MNCYKFNAIVTVSIVHLICLQIWTFICCWKCA